MGSGLRAKKTPTPPSIKRLKQRLSRYLYDPLKPASLVRRDVNEAVDQWLAKEAARPNSVEQAWRNLAADAIGTLREVATSLDGSERSSALAATARLERRRDTLAGQLDLFAKVAVVMLVFASIGACGDNLPPDVRLLAPPDAAAGADACMREPSTDGCCAHMPDEDAVRACAIGGASVGECGVVVCWLANCELARVNFCAPLYADGGCS